MLSSTIRAAVVVLALPIAHAVIIPIAAGANGLSFTPSTVTANVDDVLEFHFYPKEHSVAQGDWDSPCVPIADSGFYSGSVPVQSGESPTIFSVTIQKTDPLLFYSTVGPHCKLGMYGVVNPTGGRTRESYAILAANASYGVAPNSIFGGVLGTTPSSANTTTSPATAASSSPAPISPANTLLPITSSASAAAGGLLVVVTAIAAWLI